MAKFGFSFDDVQPDTRGNFEPLPNGEYVLKATACEERETKAGTGSYLAVTFEVAEGPHSGRRVWMNFNIHNPSEKAQNIGRQQLVSWATAAGKPDAADSDQLLDRKFTAKLGLEEQQGYAPRNKIEAFIVAGSAPKVASAPAAKPAASGTTKPRNPWDD